LGNVQRKFNSPVHLIGHDLGAVLALEIASRTPHLVQQLTLISLPYFENASYAQRSYKSIYPVNHIVFLNQFTCAVSCELTKYSSFIWYPFLPFVTQKPRGIVVDAMKNSSYPACYETLHKCIIWRTPHMIDQAASHLSNIGMPFNLIHGSLDELVPVSNVQKFFTNYSKIIQMDVFIGAGHDPVTMNTEQLATHLNKQLL